VSLGFSLPRYGGEERAEGLQVIIEPAAFADLAREMTKADPQEAIRAFGNALVDMHMQSADHEKAA
jgi:hypothetical protein